MALIEFEKAADKLDDLVDRAIAGEEILLTENGRVVARLCLIRS